MNEQTISWLNQGEQSSSIELQGEEVRVLFPIEHLCRAEINRDSSLLKITLTEDVITLQGQNLFLLFRQLKSRQGFWIRTRPEELRHEFLENSVFVSAFCVEPKEDE